MEMPATGEDGKAVSDYFEATIKTVYVKEIKAPDSYAQSDVIHKVDVEAGKTVTITATDERVKGAVHIKRLIRRHRTFFYRETVPLQEPCMVCMPERILSTQMERRAFCSKKTASSRRG